MDYYTCPTLANKETDPSGYQMDESIATTCGLANPWAGTFIRGIFTDIKKEEGIKDFELTPDNVKDYLDEIKATYSNMLSLDKMRDETKTSVDSYAELRETFSAQEFNEVVSSLAHIASAILDIQEQKGLPREDLVHNPATTVQLLKILKGYLLNGNKSAKFPETNIKGYREALNDYITNPNSQTHAKALCYSKLLQNWNSLERFIVFKLSEIENIDPKEVMRHLSQDSVYSANEVNNEEYDDESVDQFFFVDESIREGWMIVNDFINSFGSLSKRVKQILGRIIEDPDKRTVLDTPKYFDPVITYQILQYTFEHMRDSDHMVELLKNATVKGEESEVPNTTIAFIASVFEPTDTDSEIVKIQKTELKTLFYVNLRKSFERYTLSVQSKDTNKSRWYNVALNVISKRTSIDSWKARIKLRLYNDKFILARTSDRAQKIEKFRNEVKEVLASKLTPKEEARIAEIKAEIEAIDNSNLSGVQKILKKQDLESELKKLTSSDVYTRFTYYGASQKLSTLPKRKQRLKDWMDALGIKYDNSGIDNLFSPKNRRTLTAFLNKLKDFCENDLSEGKLGSTSILKNKEFIEAMEQLTQAAFPLQEKSHEQRISRITQKQGKKTSTRSSHINPSFLSDFTDTIQSFVDEGEMEGKPHLVEYLADIYLKNPQFIICKNDAEAPTYTKEEIIEMLNAYTVANTESLDDIEAFLNATSLDFVLNPWIKELLLSDLDSEKSYAANIKYTKNIGSKDQLFEDFSDKQHCAMMFNSYTYPNPNKVIYISRQEALERLDAWKNKKSTININGKEESVFINSGKYNTYYYIEGTNKGLTLIRGKLTLVDRNDYAMCPMFVMGDAGVYKSFCGRNYTAREIKDYLWNVYQQEHQKAIMLEKAHKQWIKEGGTDKNFLKIYKNAFPKKGVYSFANTVLSYFNFENESLSDIEGNLDLGGKGIFLNTPDGRAAFDEKIDKVFEEKIADTKRRLVQYGLLGEKNGNYFNPPFSLRSETADERNAEIDAKIGDFVRNSAFSNIQQFQLFTIDIQHYNNVKDLQKRYKEIHAPGTELDTKRGLTIEGFNRDYETFGYFSDIKINIEDLDVNNPAQYQYMQMLLEQHCSPDKRVYLDEMLQQGITVPDYVVENGKPKISNGKYVLHDKNHPEGSKEYRYAGIDNEMRSYYGEEGRRAILKDMLGNNYRRVYEPYLDTTLTDGQAYRTITSYRAIMIMSGKWSLQPNYNPLESIYQELKAFRRARKTNPNLELPEELRRKLMSFNKALQPTKPYTYGFEMFKLNNYEIPIPVQHKCAEVVVIPELCAEGKLKTMMEWAEDNNVDMMCSTEVAKVGCYGQVDIAHITPMGGESVAEATRRILDDSGKTIHTIPYKYYRLQTNVPEHVNASNGVGTQLRKLFYNKINKDKSYAHYIPKATGGLFSLDGVKGNELNLNGKNLIKLYNALNMAEIITSLRKVKNRITDRKRFIQDYSDNILIQPRESKDRLLSFQTDKWGHLRQSIADPIIEHDVSATMISWFKKKVLKQQISGGSAVQASAMGLNYIMEDWKEDDGGLHIIYDNNSNPIEAECEIMWDFKYVDSAGEEQIIDYNDYCNPDGTLKTNEQNVPLLDIDFPKIREMIAYRIPTENDYSVIRLKAVRFTPKINGGGTIKVPAHFTTVAGFDFDIDKLYLMRTEFKEVRPLWENLKLTKEERDKIVAKIQELHPEFVKEVSAVTEESFSAEQLYDIFAAIYEEEPKIYNDLTRIRPEGHKTPLNRYFEESKVAKAMASKKGFEDVKDYKRFLVQKAAEQLGYTPETLVTVKNGYLAIDKEAIRTKGFTPNQIYTEAAKQLGITLKRNSAEGIFETYDFTKSPLQNTGVARRNLMVELIKARWSDPETLADRTIPGGFFNSIDASHAITELKSNAPKWLAVASRGEINFEDIINEITQDDWKDPSTPLDAIDIWTILKYNQDNQLAAKLIGIFANHTNNAVFSSIMSELKIADPSFDIKFGSLTEAEIVDADGKSLETKENRIGSSFLTEYVRVTKSDGTTEIRSTTNTIIEFLAASVDAVKNPVLNVLNLTTMTAGIGATLARLGYTPYDIALLLNQPVVKQIIEYGKSNNIRSLQNCIDSVLRRNNWIKKGEDYNKMDNLDTHPSTDVMAYNIALYETTSSEAFTSNEDLRIQQLGIVKLLSQINSVASELNEFIANTKNTAANSVTSTFGGYFSREQRIRQYLIKRQNNSALLAMKLLPERDYMGRPQDATQDKVYDEFDNNSPITMDNTIGSDADRYIMTQANNPFGIEQTMFDSYTDFINTIAKMTPYMSRIYYSIRNFFASLTTNKYLDEPTINNIHYEIPAFILSRMLSPFNGDALYVSPVTGEYVKDINGQYLTNRQFYLNEFPVQVLQTKNRIGDINLFWQHITVDTYNEGDQVSIKFKELGSLESGQIDEIKAGWEECNAQLEGMAQDLVMYSFYKNGLSFGPTSMISLAPVNVLNSLIVTTTEEGIPVNYFEFFRGKYDEDENGKMRLLIPGILQGNYLDIFDNEGVMREFFLQFCLNHIDNYSLVWEARGDDATELSKIFFERNDNQVVIGSKNEVMVDVSSNTNIALNHLILDTIKDERGKIEEYQFRPIIVLDGVVYTARNPFNNGEYSGDGTMIYYRVNRAQDMTFAYGHNEYVSPTTNDAVNIPALDNDLNLEQADIKALFDKTMELMGNIGSSRQSLKELKAVSELKTQMEEAEKAIELNICRISKRK